LLKRDIRSFIHSFTCGGTSVDSVAVMARNVPEARFPRNYFFGVWQGDCYVGGERKLKKAVDKTQARA
jgi:hypothetical protein